MADREEAKRRGFVRRKNGASHPIAAIEKRILDSAAYADLAFSSRSVLILLCRNLEKDMNGHIQLSEKQAAANGIERKTLRRAFKDLLSHQLIVMTWRGGKVQGSCNKYALTWIAVKERKGIKSDHFKLDVWRDWKPIVEKTAYPKCRQDSTQNVPLTEIRNPKISPKQGDKKVPIEVIPVGVEKPPVFRAWIGRSRTSRIAKRSSATKIIRLHVTADRGIHSWQGRASSKALRGSAGYVSSEIS
jgi:hypothetical protein